MFKKILLVNLLFSVTFVFAKNVAISNNGTGDFLIAPIYIAKNGICTNIVVYNTNETNSILAKVTIRERIASHEVDLPIFLSPSDVWSGQLCGTTNGVILKSIDDSNHPAIKDELSLGKNLTIHSHNAGHKNVDFSKGYIEVYPIAQFNEKSTDKVTKDILVKRWDQLNNGDTTNTKLVNTGVGNFLSGVLQYEREYANTAVLPMMAFYNAHDRQLSGDVISYANETSASSILGINKRNQILKLLQNRVTTFTFDSYGKDQYISLTFPFGYVSNQIRTYEVTVRDMSENKNIIVKNVQIFSPKPIVQKITNTLYNEVSTISVAKIIELTEDPTMFAQGIIHIKDITNITNIQLGKGKISSFIPVKVHFTSTCKENSIVNYTTYIPSK